MSSAPQVTPAQPSVKHAWRTVLRHRWPLRCMHWINFACLLVLVGSGLQIFNAHPALYWGEASHFATPLFTTQAMRRADGELYGVTRIGDARVETTGVLGVSKNMQGTPSPKGFPDWSTIPGSRNLALGRRWHFFFAWLWVVNGACYFTWSLAHRRFSRELAMQRRDWRELPRSFVDHLRLRHPSGDAALRYNPLQKLAYLGVILVLAPLAILTGLSMSPQMDTVLGGFVDLIGGRQAARTLHFAVMSLFVLFTFVHVAMVFYAGPINELRSMITGRFRVRWPHAAAPTESGND